MSDQQLAIFWMIAIGVFLWQILWSMNRLNVTERRVADQTNKHFDTVMGFLKILSEMERRLAKTDQELEEIRQRLNLSSDEGEGGETMRKHAIILQYDPREDNYVATFPDLPDCMARGSTYDEALKNGLDAMEKWITEKEQQVLTPREGEEELGFYHDLGFTDQQIAESTERLENLPEVEDE